MILVLIMALLMANVAECPAEDSTSCVWIASERGNGEGDSFIATATGHRIYLPLI